MEYTELKSEAPWGSQCCPPADWPSKGLVTFNHVNLSYSTDGPTVLKGINATFKPSEKVRPSGQSPLLSHMMDDDQCLPPLCASGRYRGSDRGREELSDLSSVPPGRA